MKCELDIQERNPLEIFTIDRKIGEGSAGSVYYVNRKIDSIQIFRQVISYEVHRPCKQDSRFCNSQRDRNDADEQAS
jgi:NADH:ubiquinone oxidoreductase subunit